MMKKTMEKDATHQIINYRNLDINDVNANTAVLVAGETVTIIPDSGTHSVGSSKVKLKNVVDYSWEHKFYPGQILAIHISGKYIAYGIQGKDSGIIRVINLITSERALIKGIEGMTQDVAFAFVMSPVLLACIDSVGDIYVYAVEENQFNAVTCCLMLHIKQESSELSDGINRIVWCPYVPDDNESLEDDESSKFIVTRGNKVHLWNVNVVRSQHGLKPVTPSLVNDGFLEIEIDKYNIVDLAFSPDGSTVALACSDGGIRFYQVDVQEGQNPVCIHDWRPHDGKPVSCLYFLDNHLDSDCHFWKFAVTGVEGNSEIKIWTCETWSCLQTIKYSPNDDISSSSLKLKVAVDITANFILISDMQRRLLLVLQLKKNNEETEVRVNIISQFLLSYPILSFGIVKAKRDYFSEEALSSFENSVHVFNDDSRDVLTTDENNAPMKTMIKLYLVQPRALHECIIVYDTEDVTTKFNETKPVIADRYIELKDTNNKKTMNGLNSPEREVNLLTPIDLNTVANTTKLKSSEKYLPVCVIEDRAIIQSRHVASNTEEYQSDSRLKNELSRRSIEHDDISSCHIGNSGINGSQETEDVNIVRNEENENAIVSTGSSPSREVQHILFPSEVVNEICPNIPIKAEENDLPVTVWPKIPIPEPENLCPNVTDIIRINSAEKLRMIVENKETKNHSECQNHNTEWPKFYEKMEILESRLNQLTENMKSQQHDIKQSFNMLHQYLLVHKDDENKKQLTNNNDDRFNENRIVNTITQNVNSMIGNEVEYVIKEEINGNVLPSLKNTMDTFGQQFHLKMSQHLSVADQQLREHIMKIVHKKPITDALANTLSSVLPPVISSSFAEVFCNVILPKFEKSCHEMFDQVNNLFVEGTRDFLNVLQNHIRSYEEKQCNVLQTKIEELTARLNEIAETTIFNAVKRIEPGIINSVKHVLEEHKLQLESCIINANKATPSNLIHVQKQQQQEHIDYLVNQGKIDIAIEQVLSASDLKLLICLCEKLDPDKIFLEPCIIQQHILLSFIQQLSVDLNIHTLLKHRFIEGAIMCLDKKHPICEKNIPKILPAVRSRILQYINANPSNKNTRNMKILLMAVESLLTDKNDVNIS